MVDKKPTVIEMPLNRITVPAINDIIGLSMGTEILKATFRAIGDTTIQYLVSSSTP